MILLFISMPLQVSLVVLFSGLLILTYYKRLHPKLTMFSVRRETRQGSRKGREQARETNRNLRDNNHQDKDTRGES